MNELQFKQNLLTKLIEENIFSLNEDVVDGEQPFEMRLQTLCSFPKILKDIAQAVFTSIKHTKYDLIAGPSTEIPLATTLSLQFNIPMLFVRKERKQWGMEKLVEGSYTFGQKVVIIDDEISDLATALQIVGRLEGSGLTVVGYHTLFDKQIGEMEYLKQKIGNCTSVFSIGEILLHLARRQQINKSQLSQCKLYIESKRYEFNHLNPEEASLVHTN